MVEMTVITITNKLTPIMKGEGEATHRAQTCLHLRGTYTSLRNLKRFDDFC